MSDKSNTTPENIISLKGMYQDYFLDYASYVILERAVPAVLDGLKPVQRRIFHAMKQMDDGRYHKVANIIGQTMQYHPHGDAAIGDALVNLGQKDLLIDCQGNWGDVRTGDSAAASRYIEARLTKFALEILFNPQTTEWQLSYDGRKKEPIHLPAKFPLLLNQGAEGIAVGLSTKLLPHNFQELIKESIKILQGKKPVIYPDFLTGGYVDVSQYNEGERGGKVRVRAKIVQEDKKTLLVKELPYGVTTSSLIDSIVKASEKGKIKIKKVIDNTAKDVEVAIHLAPGVSPEVAEDALYAFTNCEVSISPNACVIQDNKPIFTTVTELLKICTESTKRLLGLELAIKQKELEEKWHFASLEKIFIEKRIYRDIEECETWEAVIETIFKGLEKYVVTPSMESPKDDKRLKLMRDITEDDVTRLTEIKIKRISKFNSFKADELIANIEAELKEVKYHLAHLTEYTISYYENLLKTYGKGKERRTVITTFDTIDRTQVVANNTKLYVNRKEGFLGHGLKKDEFVCDCSDIDDIIVFKKDGKFLVTKISDKTFVGKNIIHIDVWRKGDERTTYNLIYVDGKTGTNYAKRFNVKAITRDKEYDLTKGTNNSKILYFTANPNGETEILYIQLSPNCTARKKEFDLNLAEIAIKGRGAGGNIVTKYPIRKVTQLEVGKSSLGAQKIWIDQVSGRLNTEERGQYLGAFDTGDLLLALYKDGSYELTDFELSHRFEYKDLISIQKHSPSIIVSAVHYEGSKGWTMVKRFEIETSTLDTRFSFISDHKSSKLLFATTHESPEITYNMKLNSQTVSGELKLQEFIDVKGWKAMGNKLSDQRLTSVKEKQPPLPSEKLKVGDTVDFEVNNKQGKLF